MMGRDSHKCCSQANCSKFTPTTIHQTVNIPLPRCMNLVILLFLSFPSQNPFGFISSLSLFPDQAPSTSLISLLFNAAHHSRVICPHVCPLITPPSLCCPSICPALPLFVAYSRILFLTLPFPLLLPPNSVVDQGWVGEIAGL